MLILESQSTDVYRNLAIEEYLMDQQSVSGPILFLWRSACAVVLGKNQNPWRECRLDRMRTDGVPLARRISGGGTVYHDAGNLNYCVVVDRTDYKEEQAYRMVFEALKTFGIQAEQTGKSNLSVDGLKFSGNAFAFRRNRALHHGTLLIHTDLDRLNRYLGSLIDNIETHAIPSVPAPVMNLGLDVMELVAELKDSFRRVYGKGRSIQEWDPELAETELEKLENHQRSEAWMFGATPRFSVNINGIQMDVVKGMIELNGKAQQPFCDYVDSLLC